MRTSAWFDKSACCPEPADSSEKKICEVRTDNQPGAVRTIDSKCAPSSVPRDFVHALKKITRRRTDNQPGAVRTSAWFDKPACCPEPADSSERIPHPNTRAKATKAACLRTASSVRMGWMNNIAAVGCVVGENVKLKDTKIVLLIGGHLNFEHLEVVLLAPDFKVKIASCEHHFRFRSDSCCFTKIFRN